jgi:hypothetical protein
VSEPPPTQHPEAPQPPSRRGSLVLGIVLGIVYLAAFVVLNIFTPALQVSGGLLLIVPLLVYFAAAITLAVIPRTSLIGAGLLLALGISLLVGAGLCVALLAGIGQTA